MQAAQPLLSNPPPPPPPPGNPTSSSLQGTGPPTFGVSPPSSSSSPPTGWQGGPAGSSAATRGRGGLTRGRGRGRGRGGKQNDGWVKDLTREGIEPNPGPSGTEKAAATTAHPPSQAEENFEGQEREEMNDFPSSTPSDSDKAESEIFAYHAAEVQTRLPHRQPRRSKPRLRRRHNPDREGARHRRRQSQNATPQRDSHLEAPDPLPSDPAAESDLPMISTPGRNFSTPHRSFSETPHRSDQSVALNSLTVTPPKPFDFRTQFPTTSAHYYPPPPTAPPFPLSLRIPIAPPTVRSIAAPESPLSPPANPFLSLSLGEGEMEGPPKSSQRGATRNERPEGAVAANTDQLDHERLRENKGLSPLYAVAKAIKVMGGKMTEDTVHPVLADTILTRFLREPFHLGTPALENNFSPATSFRSLTDLDINILLKYWGLSMIPISTEEVHDTLAQPTTDPHTCLVVGEACLEETE
uniref:Uncharacterized protein n=1 Tax=Chromera velia CCMP2878 TaxID=1169474 RepID=A0A0G4HG96_9ALVE|eukprot:Cvel_27326.t1-p1 / transcript=Cvel_27326.t1 / gene=Cvel_27326 / organism=Chromera_velia_CCMP2878 / gene_product=hypothetical protein / transcript_product=hypothetical protein / location=Cvel_scaffold3389:15735-17135(-) / protein_length=467 / sequence_SO=supercontig / SO=protein_coding / is_pseudo=false